MKRAPSGYRVSAIKSAPKCGSLCIGVLSMYCHTCERVLARFTSGIEIIMVGSLPSRALVQMSLCDNTSPPLITLTNRLRLACKFRVY